MSAAQRRDDSAYSEDSSMARGAYRSGRGRLDRRIAGEERPMADGDGM
jgi:hypothetical protein